MSTGATLYPVANLTITVDDELLKRARIRALELDTSVSAVLREHLGAFVADERDVSTRNCLLELSASSAGGPPHVQRSWTREELYTERR